MGGATSITRCAAISDKAATGSRLAIDINRQQCRRSIPNGIFVAFIQKRSSIHLGVASSHKALVRRISNGDFRINANAAQRALTGVKSSKARQRHRRLPFASRRVREINGGGPRRACWQKQALVCGNRLSSQAVGLSWELVPIHALFQKFYFRNRKCTYLGFRCQWRVHRRGEGKRCRHG